MKFKICFIVLAVSFILLCKMTYAIPAQEDFYHNFYKIESKGFSGKVFTRQVQTGPVYIGPQSGTVNPALGEHVTLYYSYQGSYSQQWIIAPISPNSSEFYIINRATGYPLMIDGTTIRCNTSGVTDDRQRFIFKRINGDYFKSKVHLQWVVST